MRQPGPLYWIHVQHTSNKDVRLFTIRAYCRGFHVSVAVDACLYVWMGVERRKGYKRRRKSSRSLSLSIITHSLDLRLLNCCVDISMHSSAPIYASYLPYDWSMRKVHEHSTWHSPLCRRSFTYNVLVTLMHVIFRGEKLSSCFRH